MRYTITCKICKQTEVVNGQKQISAFTGSHKHGNKFAGMTGENVDLSEYIKHTSKPLITGFDSSPRKDYWRKIPGGI